MPNQTEMRTDPGRAGYRTVLAWRRTSLTAAAVGVAACYSILDRAVVTSFVPAVVISMMVMCVFVVVMVRARRLAAGDLDVGSTTGSAVTCAIVVGCSLAMLSDSVFELLADVIAP